MSYSNPANISPLPFKAGGTVAQYRAVVQDSTVHQVVATSAITQVVIGAALTSAASGEQLQIQHGGVVKLTASAAISLGAQVMPTASGAGKISTAAGATAISCGIALEAAAADGDVIAVLLITSVNGPANS